MSVVIVTKKCYLICERVNHITLQEEAETYDNDVVIPHWNIHVDFEPLSTGQGTATVNSRREEKNVVVKVGDQQSAYILFHEIVGQIREQLPDQLFLDKLVDKFLTGGALDEQTIERKHEEIHRTRKAKRERKKVFRRSKTSNRKRR